VVCATIGDRLDHEVDHRPEQAGQEAEDQPSSFNIDSEQAQPEPTYGDADDDV